MSKNAFSYYIRTRSLRRLVSFQTAFPILFRLGEGDEDVLQKNNIIRHTTGTVASAVTPTHFVRIRNIYTLPAVKQKIAPVRDNIKSCSETYIRNVFTGLTNFGSVLYTKIPIYYNKVGTLGGIQSRTRYIAGGVIIVVSANFTHWNRIATGGE